MKDALLALGARALFLAHGMLAVWKCQETYKIGAIWLLAGPVIMLFGEGLFTIAIRGGQEYKFISPCIALYLGSVVPAIWFLELHEYNERQMKHICQDTRTWNQLTLLPNNAGCQMRFATQIKQDMQVIKYNKKYADSVNMTLELYRQAVGWVPNAADLKGIFNWDSNYREEICRNHGISRLQYECEFVEGADCFNKSENVLYVERARLIKESSLGQLSAIDENQDLSAEEKMRLKLEAETAAASAAVKEWVADKVPFLQTDRNWIDIFHQLILFIIILGRWMLPKASGVTRDQLSQILLTFIGVGADILEFVTETMKEFEVRCEQFVIILMLGFWSWSLVQFVLVVSGTTKARTKMTEIFGSQGGSPVMVIEEEVEMSAWEAFWSNPEVWSIMTTMILQDGPFLGMRLYICFGRNVMKPTLIFFTVKNGIVMLLELYRLVVIATHKEDDGGDEEEDEDEELPEDELNTSKAKNRNKSGNLARRLSIASQMGAFGHDSPDEKPKKNKKNKKDKKKKHAEEFDEIDEYDEKSSKKKKGKKDKKEKKEKKEKKKKK